MQPFSDMYTRGENLIDFTGSIIANPLCLAIGLLCDEHKAKEIESDGSVRIAEPGVY